MTERKDIKQRMTPQRLEQILSAYGSQPSVWPESERESALELLKSPEEARQVLEREALLDSYLDDVPSALPSASLRNRIIAAAPKRRVTWAERLDRWASGLWPLGGSWQPVAALAAATVLGIAAGWFVPNGDQESDSSDLADVSLVDTAELGEVQ